MFMQKRKNVGSFAKIKDKGHFAMDILASKSFGRLGIQMSEGLLLIN